MSGPPQLRVKKAPSPSILMVPSRTIRSCRDEEEEESPEHFFCFCPALSSRRFRLLGKPFLDGLGDLASLSPRKIAQFVQSSNWTPF
ncbi:hypothetical protein ACLKA6_005848 [Drosophila palustris]